LLCPVDRRRRENSSAVGVVKYTFFLDTERLFPLFGLPLRLDD
jgi:hypothetical protein